MPFPFFFSFVDFPFFPVFLLIEDADPLGFPLSPVLSSPGAGRLTVGSGIAHLFFLRTGSTTSQMTLPTKHTNRGRQRLNFSRSFGTAAIFSALDNSAALRTFVSVKDMTSNIEFVNEPLTMAGPQDRSVHVSSVIDYVVQIREFYKAYVELLWEDVLLCGRNTTVGKTCKVDERVYGN